MYTGQVIRVPLTAAAVGAMTDMQLVELQNRIGFANNGYYVIQDIARYVATRTEKPRGAELLKITDQMGSYRAWIARGPAPMGPVVEFARKNGAWEQMTLVAAASDPATNITNLELFKVPGVLDISITNQYDIMGQSLRMICNEASIYGLKAIPKLRIVEYGAEVQTPNYANPGNFCQLPLCAFLSARVNDSTWSGLLPVFEGQLKDQQDLSGDPVLVNGVDFLKFVRESQKVAVTAATPKAPLYSDEDLGNLAAAYVAAGLSRASLGKTLREWATATL